MATAPTTVSQQIVSESPEVEAYKLNLLKNASNLAYNVDANGNLVASLASQLPQYQIAGFAPSQTAALTAAANMGIGAFAPYVNQAQSNLTQATGATREAADIARGSDTRGQFAGAQQALTQGIGGLGQATGTVQGAIGQIASGQGQYDPNSAAAYMNPYIQQVLQAQLGEMNRQSQMQQQANTSQATRAGAFGGDRAAIQQAETQRNNTQLQNQAIANAYGQNYAQAQQAAMQAYEQGQQRDLAAGQATTQAGQALSGIAGQRGQLGQGIGSLAAQQYGIGQNMATTMGGLGGQLGNLGVQQAALGQTAQQMNSNDINMLYNAGQTQQAQNQQVKDAERANTLQQVYAPYQQAGFISDIYKGAPSSQMSTSAASTPTASPFMQAAGLGIAGLAAGAGAKKAGLF